MTIRPALSGMVSTRLYQVSCCLGPWAHAEREKARHAPAPDVMAQTNARTYSRNSGRIGKLVAQTPSRALAPTLQTGTSTFGLPATPSRTVQHRLVLRPCSGYYRRGPYVVSARGRRQSPWSTTVGPRGSPGRELERPRAPRIRALSAAKRLGRRLVALTGKIRERREWLLSSEAASVSHTLREADASWCHEPRTGSCTLQLPRLLHSVLSLLPLDLL